MTEQAWHRVQPSRAAPVGTHSPGQLAHIAPSKPSPKHLCAGSSTKAAAAKRLTEELTVCAQALPARHSTHRAQELGREHQSSAGRDGDGEGEMEMGQNQARSTRTRQGELEPDREHQNQAGSTRTRQGTPEPDREH